MHPEDKVIQVILEYLKYKKGNLYWKKNNGNRGRAGNIVDGVCGKIKIGNMYLYKSRIIFFFTRGYLPPSIVFIDGDKKNFDPDNLQEFVLYKNNKSGFLGVSFKKSISRWIATLTRNKKLIFSRPFKTRAAAHKAYCKAVKEYNQKRLEI